jgi:glycosyltransferase involved in cell wall biosynthesis
VSSRDETAPIAFDLRQAAGRPTGVGRYLLSIVDALAEGPDVGPLRSYVRRGRLPPLPTGVEVRASGARGASWHAAVWYDLQRWHARAYVSTSLILPSLPGVPALPVILDVTSLQYPQFHTARTRLFERLLLGGVARRFPLITGTATAAHDIREWLRTDVPITVVPPTVTTSQPAGDPDPVLARIGATRPYVVAVGTLEPRKNLSLAVEAVREIRRRGVELTLVLIGSMGWHTGTLDDVIVRAEAEGAVRRSGYVSDGDRDALYSGASALLMPSFYEGFGMPLLEAMAAGIPCLSSNTPTLQEVAAGAALHAAPDDLEGWVASLERLATDDRLRDQLRVRGLVRASQFTPKATATAFQRALATMR